MAMERAKSRPTRQYYQLAVGRLKSTIQRLWRDPHLLQMYADVIQEQLDSGVIEKISSDADVGPLKHSTPCSN